MKKLILIFPLLLICSCGVSKKYKETKKETASIEISEKLSQQTIAENNSVSTFNYNQYLNDIGLKITSKGGEFHFQIGDFKFVGDADVEFSNNKAETKVITEYKVHTTYKSSTTYKSHIVYKTKTLYRTVNVDANKPSFWLFALLYCAGLLTIPLTKLIIKKQL